MPALRRLLSLLLAVALVAAGIFLIVEVVAAWFGSGPVLLSDTATTTWRTTAWDDAAVIWTAVIVGVVGLLCLVAALWPDTPTTVPSRLEDVELERRPLEQVLQRELQAVDGVADASVKVRRIPNHGQGRHQPDARHGCGRDGQPGATRRGHSTPRRTHRSSRHAASQAGTTVKRDVRSTRRGDRVALALLGALLLDRGGLGAPRRHRHDRQPRLLRRSR